MSPQSSSADLRSAKRRAADMDSMGRSTRGCPWEASQAIEVGVTRTLVVLLLFTAPALAAEQASGPADRVYLNGVVFTADARNSTASALAIRDGRILYVGSDDALARYIGPATVKVDLQKRLLMPGLVDGHMHPV